MWVALNPFVQTSEFCWSSTNHLVVWLSARIQIFVTGYLAISCRLSCHGDQGIPPNLVTCHWLLPACFFSIKMPVALAWNSMLSLIRKLGRPQYDQIVVTRTNLVDKVWYFLIRNYHLLQFFFGGGVRIKATIKAHWMCSNASLDTSLDMFEHPGTYLSSSRDLSLEASFKCIPGPFTICFIHRLWLHPP